MCSIWQLQEPKLAIKGRNNCENYSLKGTAEVNRRLSPIFLSIISLIKWRESSLHKQSCADRIACGLNNLDFRGYLGGFERGSQGQTARLDPNYKIVDVYPGRDGDDSKRDKHSDKHKCCQLLSDRNPHASSLYRETRELSRSTHGLNSVSWMNFGHAIYLRI